MTIDVTEILTDSDLATTFNVIRRAETVGTNGRQTTTNTTFSNVVGVVTAIGPNDLDRQDGYEKNYRSISVVTKFNLRGASTGYQPDIIFWRGTNYVVRAIDNYPQFGQGFYQVECTSMDQIDDALTTGLKPQLSFNLINNSEYVGVIYAS